MGLLWNSGQKVRDSFLREERAETQEGVQVRVDEQAVRGVVKML